jgi:hypothetical protein
MKGKRSFLSCISGVFLWLFSWVPLSLTQENVFGSIDCLFRLNNNNAQVVIWIEDEAGRFAGTVFITDFIGRRGGGNRTADPDIDSGEGNRLSCFPVWVHRRNVIDTTYGIDNLYPPPAGKPSYPDDMDAVSEATPRPVMQIKTWMLSGPPSSQYTCWIEVNRSFDFNEHHSYSWYRAQPSVVFAATLQTGASADSAAVLDYIGYGSPDGSDGAIRPPDSTITTAAGLLMDMGGYRFKAVFSPGGNGLLGDPHGSAARRSFQLGQNYPNPFNSTTAIEYFLPETSLVRLSIIGLDGKTVTVLENGEMSPGWNRSNWDGRGFSGKEAASGIYFYRVTAGEYSETRRMMLLR